MTRDLGRQLWSAIRTLIVLTVICGVIYPLAVWVIGDAALRHQAEGSLVTSGNHVVGSSLIGQTSNGARWFHGRPSAGGDNPLATGASNLGADNPALTKAIRARLATVTRQEHVPASDVPPDAVTASGSGIDPDISPAYAQLQIARVARANQLSAATVRQLVSRAESGRDLGFLGEPVVNVVRLNLAVAQAAAHS